MPRVEVDRQLGGVPTPAIDMQKAEKRAQEGYRYLRLTSFQLHAIRCWKMPRYEVVVQASSRMRVIAYATCRCMAEGPVWGAWGIKVEQFPASGLLE